MIKSLKYLEIRSWGVRGGISHEEENRETGIQITSPEYPLPHFRAKGLGQII